MKMINFRMVITLKTTNFKTIGVPTKIHYHENQDVAHGGQYSCGCWQCCKIDSSQNLTDFETAMNVYRSSQVWLDHHYD